MSERGDEQERGDEGREERGMEEGGDATTRGRARDQGLAGAGYTSTERDQTRAREQVRSRPIDEAGEIPSADADVEAGISRRAERYED